MNCGTKRHKTAETGTNFCAGTNFGGGSFLAPFMWMKRVGSWFQSPPFPQNKMFLVSSRSIRAIQLLSQYGVRMFLLIIQPE